MSNAIPSRSEFVDLSERYGQIPVTLTASCDGVSIVDVFEALCPDGGGFILDGASPEPGASRYAYVGVGRQLAYGPLEPSSGSPFRELRRNMGAVAPVRSEDLPPFAGGAVGYFAYEAVRHLEPSVGPLRPDPTCLPEAAFIFPSEMIAFDRVEGTATTVVVVDRNERDLRTSYDSAARRCEELLQLVVRLSGATIGGHSLERGTRRAMGAVDETLIGDQLGRSLGRFVTREVVTRSEYEQRVETARQAIIDGELIQVVLSQRIERPTNARPLDVYRELAYLNPSTYMFYLGFGPTESAPAGFHIVGSSPELMTRVRGSVASVHPIAGTRPRSADSDADGTFEREIVASEKERAEHIMLVDLARNDVGRVCRPGTVEVPYLMRTERYSHVMHLVSRVRGQLRPDCDGISAFEAGFPIGTLAGAPKIRAMQLISELETEGRGPYCGGVGWFGANGDLDTGTIIRSIVFRDGVAHIQGGGGIVFDSDPSAEYEESLQKTRAQLEAIEAAEQAELNTPPGRQWRSPQVVHA